MDKEITSYKSAVHLKDSQLCDDFLFGLQNIVKLKGTLLDCWGRPHPTLEKHVYKAGNSSKNSVHDSIKELKDINRWATSSTVASRIA
ncbi:hypothetical protein T08_7450 [Trichinella sp. T8]|nr:hypothetical protein T08_7450 [Trichinella sp. T8]